MQTLRIFVLLACLCLPAHAADPADARAATPELRQFLERSSVRYNEEDSFERRLFVWTREGATVAELEARTVRDYGVPADLAHELVAMTLRSTAIKYDDRFDAERQRIEARRLALVDAHPGVWLAFEEAARDVAAFDECDGARIDALVAKWSDPDDARLRLAPAIHCMQVLSPRTSVAGAGAEPFVAFARRVESWTGGPFPLAALRVAVAKADADPSIAPGVAAELHALRLKREMEEGRLSAAVAALPAPDAPGFAAIVANLTASERLDIAGAAAATGHADLARRWRDVATTPSPQGIAARTPEADSNHADEQQAEQAAAHAKRLELLAWALGERRGDPFDLLVANGARHETPFEGHAWHALMAAVALREGYPTLAQPRWMPDAESVERTRKEALEQCHRCAPELLAAIEVASRETSVRDAALPSIPEVTERDDRATELLARIDRAIDGPALPWIEQPLPPAQRTARAAPKDDEDCGLCLGDAPRGGTEPAWHKRLPRGELVRWERHGDRIVAITASQTLDPVGELSSGGYWVSVSDDAGKSFAPPLYTGLRVFAPYVVRPQSKLPLLDGDALQVEVAVRELDAEHVVFPPIRLPLKREADDLFLRIGLAELRRDGDGDGVPDPIEAAMLLDPAAADTDGDGVVDGADMLPNVAWRDTGNDDRAAALAVALEEMFGHEFGAIITSAAHVGGEPATSGPVGVGSTASNDRGVVFLQAPPDALARMHLRKPVVVLGEAQVARLRKVRGAFYPIRVFGFALNRAGDEGVVSWSAGWRGGAFRLHKRDGRWVAETTSDWITGSPAARPGTAS